MKELRFSAARFGEGPVFQQRASSTASITAAESGSTVGAKRFTTRPSLLTRNFSKFHFTNPGSSPLLNLVSSA